MSGKIAKRDELMTPEKKPLVTGYSVVSLPIWYVFINVESPSMMC